MGLILKHVQKLDNGIWRYSRRVPDLGEITEVLGQSQKEALERYPLVHTGVEKLFSLALKATRAPALKSQAAKSALQLHQDALERVRELGVDPFPETHLTPTGRTTGCYAASPPEDQGVSTKRSAGGGRP